MAQIGSTGITSRLRVTREQSRETSITACEIRVLARPDKWSSAYLLFRIAPGLVQLRILRFGLLEDGDVRVGVFPKRKEILIGSTSSCCITPQNGGTSEAEMSKRADWLVERDAAMVENFLKLCGSFAAPMCGQMGLSSHKDGVQGFPSVSTGPS